MDLCVLNQFTAMFYKFSKAVIISYIQSLHHLVIICSAIIDIITRKAKEKNPCIGIFC